MKENLERLRKECLWGGYSSLLIGIILLLPGIINSHSWMVMTGVIFTAVGIKLMDSSLRVKKHINRQPIPRKIEEAFRMAAEGENDDDYRRKKRKKKDI